MLLFVVEYALAQLWLSFGVKPDYVCGHSVGEYVAAVIAGVMSFEDGTLWSQKGEVPEGDDHLIPMDEFEKKGTLSSVCSRIVLKLLFPISVV